MGNYCATSATHYNQDGTGAATDTGSASGNLYDSRASNRNKLYAGNGAIPFWQLTGTAGAAQNSQSFTKTKGIGSQGMQRDGTSNTIMFAESREEEWSSWMSGYSSYVVAADPNGPGNKLVKIAPPTSGGGTSTQPPVLQWNATDSLGQTALNVGTGVKRAGGSQRATDPGNGAITDPTTQAYFYYFQYPHAGTGASTNRVFGPSSAHSGGVVLHGYGDGHGRAVQENVQRDSYLWQVSRQGGEVIPEN